MIEKEVEWYSNYPLIRNSLSSYNYMGQFITKFFCNYAMLPNLKVIRYESTRLNWIVPNKVHRVITPQKKHHINSRYSSCQKSLILCETKFRPQFHLVSDMEVRCYLKAKTEEKYLPALFCLLLLTRQFDKAGVIPFFIHTRSRRTFWNSIPIGIILQRVRPRIFKSFVILGAFCCWTPWICFLCRF